MDTFNRWVTKKSVLILSLAILGIQICGLLFFHVTQCSDAYPCSGLLEVANLLFGLFWSLALFSFPLLVFSFTTYFLRNKVFKGWIWFTIIWFVLCTIVIPFVSNDRGSSWMSVGISEQDVAVLYAAILYSVVSIFIILIQSIRVYWLKK